MTIAADIEAQRQMLLAEPMTHREFCSQIIIPDGDLKGQPLDPDIHPAQREYIRAVDSGYRKTVLLKPTQDGGSLITSVPIIKRAVREGQTCIIAYPTLDKAKAIFADKWMPVLAGFGGTTFTRGGGSRGGVAPEMRLPGGGKFLLRKEGGRGESSQASDTADASQVDEVDDWRDLHRVKLIGERLNRAADPFLGYVSTLKKDTGSIILQMYEDPSCTQSVMEYPCHACGDYHWLTWPQVDVEREVYVCPHCQADWSETQRLASLRVARRHDERPAAPAFSLRWTALESPFSVMVEGRKLPVLRGLCALFRAATAKAAVMEYGPIRSFYRDRLTQPFIEPEPEGEITAAGLARCSERSTVNKRTVPAWALFLVMTQDVQGDRHYWMVVAHGPDERWAVVDWGYEMLVAGDERAPTPEDRRRVLGLIRDLANEGWPVEGGESRLHPVQRGVDGGYLPDELAAWVQGEPAWKFLRGVGQDNLKHAAGGAEKTLPAEIRATRALQAVRPPGWRIYWWKIDGHHFRKLAHAALLRHADQPASGLVPRGLKANDALLLHLSGEVWEEGEPGKKAYWREVRKRHDWLDCLVYNLALALLHRHAPDRRDEPITPTTKQPDRPKRDDFGDAVW